MLGENTADASRHIRVGPDESADSSALSVRTLALDGVGEFALYAIEGARKSVCRAAACRVNGANIPNRDGLACVEELGRQLATGDDALGLVDGSLSERVQQGA